jgi:uncharacterized protein
MNAADADTEPETSEDAGAATGDPSPQPLERLLVVQRTDTHIDQLRHERANLPARARLVSLGSELSAIEGDLDAVASRRDELARSQRRLEDDVAGIEAKVAHDEGTLYGGSVTAPRELQDLQAEIESLRRRQSSLEDEVLELMEAIEPLDAQAGELERRRANVAASREETERELTAQEAELDVQIEREQATRADLVDGMDVTLLDEYARLRSQLGGVGIARLEGGRCQGCQLLLSAVERDRIKGLADDALLHCEECGRLLVR